ncbi:MAG: efflux RND transporter periplasmic adaptor subunit [Rhodospirillales bacterium]|nr:efflux RND transporter periplasmic adaptor subunit [Rhodospirillales bacterium]
MTAITVTAAPLAIELANIGTVQAWQSVVVRTRVDGTLEKVFFREGQEVQPGDKLAEIDPRPYQAAVNAARAKKAQDQAVLANALRDLARYASLAKSDFASRQQLDTQQALVGSLAAALKGDDAAIEAARVNLDYTLIRAPFDGRAGLRQIDVGNVIRAADPAGVGIVTITQIHPIAVLFNLPQEQLPAIQTAMAQGRLPVVATSSDGATMLGQGELLTTDNTIDATTGTIRLKAVFPNADNHLWPGQFVQARLKLATLHQVLTVPSVAVQRSQTGLFVYIVKPNATVGVQKVAIGQDDGTYAVVTSGLADGAQVVVSGQSRLRDGSHVAVSAAKAAS